MNWLRSQFEAGILFERSEHEECVLRLDTELLDFNFVGGVYAVAQKETADVVGHFFFGGEEGVAEFLMEVAMQVEVGAARVDHDRCGVVVQKKRNMHALSGHLDPFTASALALPFPDEATVVIAGAGRDGGDHGVGTDGQTAEFDHSEGCAANLGNRRVENEVTALQQAKALKEYIDSSADSDAAINGKAAWTRGTQQQDRWNQESDPLGLDSGAPRIEASGAGRALAAEKGEVGLPW